MTTVGELRRYLSTIHEGASITVDFDGNKAVKGLEFTYDVTSNAVVVKPVLSRHSLLIEAKS
jgi:hypothetical protein